MNPDGRTLRRITASRSRRIAGFLGLAVLVMLCSGPAVGDDGMPPENPANPPFLRGFATTVGLAEAVPGKQFFRVPPTAVYTRLAAREDGQTGVYAEVFVQSPKGAKQKFGILPPTRVRTVALGLAPAVVTLDLRQLRKKYIEPWILVGGNVFEQGAENILNGRVNVRVAELKIDGQRVRLPAKCRTAFPAAIHVEGDAQYTSGFGGEMTGTLDVPPFTGCGKGNSRLLTSVVSGADNPIKITQTKICLDESCPPAPNPPPEYPLPNN